MSVVDLQLLIIPWVTIWESVPYVISCRDFTLYSPNVPYAVQMAKGCRVFTL